MGEGKVEGRKGEREWLPPLERRSGYAPHSQPFGEIVRKPQGEFFDLHCSNRLCVLHCSDVALLRRKEIGEAQSSLSKRRK